MEEKSIEEILIEYDNLRQDHEELLRRKTFKNEVLHAFTHDLKGPLTTLEGSSEMIEEYLTNISRLYTLSRDNPDPDKLSKIDKEINKYIFEARRFAKIIQSSAQRASNLANLIRLSEISQEEFNYMAKDFNPIHEIKVILNSSIHPLIRRGLGLRLFYQKELTDITFNTNLGAFHTIYGNLIDNAIQYALANSVILARISKEGNNFDFEIENLILNEIDNNQLKFLFEKGYRLDPNNSGERNEGFGLYFLSEAVKKGYGGTIYAYGQGNFRITNERTDNFEKIEFGTIYPESFQPFTPFHAKVSIPIDLIEKKQTTLKKEVKDQDNGIMAYI